MKKYLLGLALALGMVACRPVQSDPTVVAPTATPVPTVSAPQPHTTGTELVVKVTPVVAAYDDNAVPDCSNATVTWGSGKENYCKIKAAFITKFGVAPKGKIWFYARLKDMQGLMADEANGLPKLVKQYGCDPKGWGPRVSSPSFGPFTGAQHEFGGNEYLAAAFLVDGLTRADQAHWLLYGNFDRVKSYPCNGVDLKK